MSTSLAWRLLRSTQCEISYTGTRPRLCHRLLQRRRFASKLSDAPTASDLTKPTTTLSARLLAPLRAYGRAQQRRPWLTQFFTTSTIFFLGDFSAQSVASTDTYDPLRGARAWLIGAGLAIPGYTWFTFLARHFNFASSYALGIATKVLVQQCVFMPIVQTYFFGASTLLAGEGLEAAGKKIRDTVPVSWVNSWKVWPAVMVVTFTVVPVQWRSVVNGAVGCGWQTYLSWLNQRAEAKEGEVSAGVKRQEAVIGSRIQQKL